MPSIHFEYTNNLRISGKIKSLLKEIHHILVDVVKTDLQTCRSLITPYSDYVVGNGDDSNAFMQLSIKMLPGRSDEIKNKLGKILFSKLQHTFHDELENLNTEIRVYLQDVDIKHYYGLKK